MVVYGGTGNSENETGLEAVYSLSLDTFEWQKNNNVQGETPFARDSHSCVLIGHRMYIFAGNSEEALGDMQCYDILGKTWRKI